MLAFILVFLLSLPTDVYAEGKSSETAFSVSSGLHDKKIRELRDRQAEINIRELRRKKEEEKAKKKESRHKIYNQ